MDISIKKYILRYLLLKMQSEEINVGDKLPSEQALAIKFDCNRHTARSAMQALKNSHLISSNNGVGNFVATNMEETFGIKHSITSDSIKYNLINKKLLPIFFLNYVDDNKKIFEETYFHRNKTIAKSYTIINKEIQGEIDEDNNLPQLLAYNGVCIFEVKENHNYNSKPKYVEWKNADIITITQKYINEDGECIAWVLTNLDASFYKKTKNFQI